jgi:hypothetical protein
MRVYKRKGSRSYQCEFYDATGIRIQKSTRCRDYEAAQQRARQWEREAADPDGARLRSATLNEALELFVRSRSEMVGQGKRSGDTLSFYIRKCGVLARSSAGTRDSPRSDRPHVADYVTARRGHLAVRPRKPRPPRLATGTAPGPKPRPAPAPRFVQDHTIYKEVSILRAVLKLAKKRGLWRGDLDVVMPASGRAVRRVLRRASGGCPWDEVQLLLGELTKDRGARVSYAIALGAERGATDRALRVDIMHKPADVLVRGTKRPSRWRLVPVVTRRAARAAGPGGGRCRGRGRDAVQAVAEPRSRSQGGVSAGWHRAVLDERPPPLLRALAPRRRSRDRPDRLGDGTRRQHDGGARLRASRAARTRGAI